MYYAVIMLGEYRIQFWLLSRQYYPDQALKPVSQRIMFQCTLGKVLLITLTRHELILMA